MSASHDVAENVSFPKRALSEQPVAWSVQANIRFRKSISPSEEDDFGMHSEPDFECRDGAQSSPSFQHRLNHCVSDAMRASGKKLDQFARDTGICKTQLSKMQNGRRRVSYEHAEAIFRACGLHPRAMLLLCGLSAEELALPATTAFLDQLLEGLPSLLRLLFDDVQVVDPSWGSSSVSVLQPLLMGCIERAKARDIDIFAATAAAFHARQS